MSDVERLIGEHMQTEKFFDAINDDMSFADALIDSSDLNRLFYKEDNEDA